MKAIANILREAADKIAALDPPATLTASEPSLPDPPKPSPLAGLISPIGFHKAMMGPIPVPAENFNLDIVKLIQGKWASGWLGNDPDGGTYALRIGSEIARLNGLEPEAIPADKQPEPVKRREWDVHLDKLGDIWDCVEVNEEMDDGMICVRVREVLPGDPTPEQVEELVRTLQNAFTFRVTNHPTSEAEARKALQPFTGKEKP